MREAKLCANTILQMKSDLSDSISEKISDVERSVFFGDSVDRADFFVDGGSESFVRIEDFGGPNSYFQIPPDFRIPLDTGGTGSTLSVQQNAVDMSMETLNLR